MSRAFDRMKQIARKPVSSHGDKAEAHPGSAPDDRPTVRLVTEQVRDANNTQVDLDKLDPDSIAPALSMMNIYDRADSAMEDSDNPRSSYSPKSDRKIPRSSLEKPLPEAPGEGAVGTSVDGQSSAPPVPAHRRYPEAELKRASRRDMERELGVSGILNLEDSEDTTYHERQAPAVVHETIEQPVHEIRHEVYEREFHEHDYHHRILPVREVEVLPARHFVEDAHGRRREVSADFVHGSSPEYTQRLLTECFKDTLPKGGHTGERRQFTARGFADSEGDYKESLEPTGTLRSERWWVHPPTLEQSGAMNRGAYTVHLD